MHSKESIVYTDISFGQKAAQCLNISEPWLPLELENFPLLPEHLVVALFTFSGCFVVAFF